MTIRVALWGTGDVGHYALRGILTHPELDLVGVRVWHEDKVGQDAAALIGWAPVGVATTDSTAEILALRPDCLVHTGPQNVIDPLPEFLAAGIDVVTLATSRLAHPPTCPPKVREPLEAACEAGNASLFYGGIDPGWASHTLPLVLSGISERIDLMTVYEVRDYDPLPVHQLDWLAYGQPNTDGSAFFGRGGITKTWGPSMRLIADALGITVDSIEEFHDFQLAPETFEVPAMTIREGTVAALRFGLRVQVDGHERLRLEHVNRLRRDLAPDWLDRQGYGVIARGAPDYNLHLDLEDPSGVQTRPALFGTAMYGVNAVPAVCAARPGILTVLDLPFITGGAVGGVGQPDNWTISYHIKRGEVRPS